MLSQHCGNSFVYEEICMPMGPLFNNQFIWCYTSTSGSVLIYMIYVASAYSPLLS